MLSPEVWVSLKNRSGGERALGAEGGGWRIGVSLPCSPTEPPRDAGRGAHQRTTARQVAEVRGRLLLHQRGLLSVRHDHLYPHCLLPASGGHCE